MQETASPTQLRLDGDALVANWRALSKLGGLAKTGAALKADGYGLGGREVAKRLAAAGCEDFFVAHWSEAAAIADIVPAGYVAVLNGLTNEDIGYVRGIGAVPVLNTPRQIAQWKAAGGGRCHVMVDSGINRLGLGTDQIEPELFDGLDIDILMSHLASADENSAQNADQLKRFAELAAKIPSARRSLANSAGIMLGTDYHWDLTRPGIALYGGIVRPEMAEIIAPVVRISAKVLQVRELVAGEKIGYNATYICRAATRVATAALGYADGYYRGFSSKGTACFEGRALPLIGRVSMDLVTIDATGASDIKEGDCIDISFDLPEASRQSGMSQYELLTGLSRRAERLWV